MKKYTTGLIISFMIILSHTTTFVPSIFASKNPVKETEQYLKIIRSVGLAPLRKNLDKYDRNRNKIWSFLLSNKIKILPLIEKELKLEIAKKEKNHFLLLDMGYFLLLQGSIAEKNTAVQALYSIDTAHKSVTSNFDQLFSFTYQVSRERYPGILGFIDRNFFPNNKLSITTSQDSLTLDGSLICTFLYGAYGPDSEEHILNFISDPDKQQRVVNILTWIGTEGSATKIDKLLRKEKDYSLISRALTYLLQNGGPQGLKVILNLDRKKLDAQTQKFFDRIYTAAKKTTLSTQKIRYNRHPGKLEFSDEELKEKLSNMYLKGKLDRTLNPLAIINSKLSNKYLLQKLGQIRKQMFSRISYQGMGDIQFINALMNTIQFRKNSI